ncbi:MAG: YbjN domain-containing protein [Pseudomonadota bacterium]|nr:YbjN domain-containing protein [Pseudomonadota bacterium]
MSDRLRQLADRVSDFLVRMDIDPDRNPEGIFLLKYGSTVVMVSIFEDEKHVFVRFASTLLSGARPQLELVMRLLRMNTEVLFGAFLLFEDDAVSFTHTLLGDTLSFEEFSHALHYVARVSDDHDEELQALAGGQRAEEILAEGS